MIPLKVQTASKAIFGARPTQVVKKVDTRLNTIPGGKVQACAEVRRRMPDVKRCLSIVKSGMERVSSTTMAKKGLQNRIRVKVIRTWYAEGKKMRTKVMR